MKTSDTLLIVVVLALVACLSFPFMSKASDLETFQVAVRTSFMNPTLSNQLAESFCGLWDKATTDVNKAWVMQGWAMNYCLASNTSQYWQVYRVTTLQCRQDTMYAYTESNRNSLVKKIENNPNIYAGFGHDPEGQLEEWGITKQALPPIDP